MEALQRSFLWEGGKQTGRRLHLINWDKVSKPLLEGGLSLKNTKVQNLALGEKLLWYIVSGDTAWCKEALWKKYFRGTRKRCVENPCRETKGSPIYNLCRKAIDHFTPHLTWVPGNGKKIKIWEDSILGDPPGIEPEPSTSKNMDGWEKSEDALRHLYLGDGQTQFVARMGSEQPAPGLRN
jgi:hypothetical protein